VTTTSLSPMLNLAVTVYRNEGWLWASERACLPFCRFGRHSVTSSFYNTHCRPNFQM